MSQNPNSNNKLDTTRAHWHGDVDLEVVLGWHAFAYLCTLLGCYKDVLQTNGDNGDSHDHQDIELESNGALDIHEDAQLLHIYKQVKFRLD